MGFARPVAGVGLSRLKLGEKVAEEVSGKKLSMNFSENLLGNWNAKRPAFMYMIGIRPLCNVTGKKVLPLVKRKEKSAVSGMNNGWLYG